MSSFYRQERRITLKDLEKENYVVTKEKQERGREREKASFPFSFYVDLRRGDSRAWHQQPPVEYSLAKLGPDFPSLA